MNIVFSSLSPYYSILQWGLDDSSEYVSKPFFCVLFNSNRKTAKKVAASHLLNLTN